MALGPFAGKRLQQRLGALRNGTGPAAPGLCPGEQQRPPRCMGTATPVRGDSHPGAGAGHSAGSPDPAGHPVWVGRRAANPERGSATPSPACRPPCRPQHSAVGSQREALIIMRITHETAAAQAPSPHTNSDEALAKRTRAMPGIRIKGCPVIYCALTQTAKCQMNLDTTSAFCRRGVLRARAKTASAEGAGCPGSTGPGARLCSRVQCWMCRTKVVRGARPRLCSQGAAVCKKPAFCPSWDVDLGG